jgi:pyruvate/2-oxoglutarate dehydrogenase complex dihydrolipoamide dehydrogenase (E3) component
MNAVSQRPCPAEINHASPWPQEKTMSTTEHYDVLVIGSGEAGKYLAWTLSKEGHRTALVERTMVGGSCPNVACLPSKNVIHSAKVASLAARASTFGIRTNKVATDMAGVQQRKRRMVEDLVSVHLARYQASGVDLIMGEARFVAAKTIAVDLRDGGMRNLSAERVVLSVGTRAAIPDVPGLTDARPMTHVEALDLERVPERLIVIGGGYVGLEFAQAAGRFGSHVTVIEKGVQLAGREDADVATALLELLRDENIEVLLRADVRRVEGRSGQHVRLEVETEDGVRAVEGTDILVAAGRTPNTSGIGVELAGIELNSRGYVVVSDRLETTAPGVWAVGDCAGSPQFTHVAFDDFRVVHDTLNGGTRTTRDRLVPFCMFTDPELARVGLNESDARARGVNYRLATMPMSAVLRTRTLSEPRGFMKMLLDADSDRILGFTVFGAEASELMATVQTAMLGQLPFTVLRDALFTHPTAAEGLTVLLTKVESKER